MRASLVPAAIRPRVPVVQGQMTICRGAPEPEATGAVQALAPNTDSWPSAA